MMPLALLLLSLAVLLPAPARAWTLPDTGQTTCYDDTGVIIACSTSGTYPRQDGAYSGSKLTYNDNGDGTVTDLNTGLMWQKATSSSTMVWANAGSYCSGQGLNGYGDWRLPSITELLTITKAGTAIPACDSTLSCISDVHWSSTPEAGGSWVWAAALGDGYLYPTDKTNVAYARCVRTGP